MAESIVFKLHQQRYFKDYIGLKQNEYNVMAPLTKTLFTKNKC